MVGLAVTLLGIWIVLLGGGLLGALSLNLLPGRRGQRRRSGSARRPFFLVERAISGQLARVDERVDEARQESREARQSVERVAAATEATLSELSQEVRAGLARIREQDRNLHERVVEDVTHENLLALMRRAMELNAVDRLGLRVALDDTGIWIRARTNHRQDGGADEPVWLIEMVAQHANGTAIGTASALWSPGEPAATPFVRVAKELQRAGAYPGDERFDAGRIVAALADAVQTTIELRTGASGDRQVRPVFEVVNDDWAITQFGLDSLRFDLWADAGSSRVRLTLRGRAFRRIRG